MIDTVSYPNVNPRYVAYAAAHGKTPDAMMAHDEQAYVGCMCGFMLWISEMSRAFWKENPGAFLDRYTISDHDAWTAFLQRNW